MVATLVFLPAIYVIFARRGKASSVSLDPDDRHSLESLEARA
jgi:hypothetical protein